MAPPTRRREPVAMRFLLPGERVVVDQRQHWAVIVLPLLYTFAALIFVVWVDRAVRLDGGPFANILWLLWLVLAVWALFQVAQWRHDRFIATDKRLLLNYGLFTTKVAMMPMSKVTDMSYQRTVAGRVLGFGRFVLESAGQDQALRQVDWVRDPDDTYYRITDVLFSAVTRDPEDGDEYDDVEPDVDDGEYAPYGRAATPEAQHTGWADSPVQENGPYSDERYSPDLYSEDLYSSRDEVRRRREARTGPIPPPPYR